MLMDSVLDETNGSSSLSLMPSMSSIFFSAVRLICREECRTKSTVKHEGGKNGSYPKCL